MALGGGNFTTQNKILPGSYINFISALAASSQLSDRGFVAVPLELDWGKSGEVFRVDAADVEKDSLKLFGYEYSDTKMKNIREIFRNARTLFAYRLNGGIAATVTTGALTATARHSGTRGNDLKVVIAESVDNVGLFEVSTYLGTKLIETQVVADADSLADNDFVVFTGTGALAETAGVDLAGGSNKAAVDGADYQAFLDKIEAYSFNVLGCPSTTAEVIALFVAFTRRLRDTNGVKFQTVAYRTESADYEGVISVQNTVTDAGANAAALIYWVAGAAAGCPVNRSNTNKEYDGEYTVNVDFTQVELEQAIQAGKLMFHRVGEAVRLLQDVNTFTSFAADKSADFASNQVIRVLDQIGNDVAVLFNTRYLGRIQNNASGRISFWNDLVRYGRELETIQAIEGFAPADVVVQAGEAKNSVVVNLPITPVSALEKLYMTVVVN